ncbi:MAG: hypothetical protein ACLTAZ_12880 [Dysosmobacter welbionis]|uniref:AlkZ-related protein n=1 Tax=Dysosmobacter welbionis TaxID=2093857 RepID=UPI00399363FA
MSGLQIEGDLVIRDFRRRINRRGLPYGWPISVYTTPEALWGCGHVISAYAPPPNRRSGSSGRSKSTSRRPQRQS